MINVAIATAFVHYGDVIAKFESDWVIWPKMVWAHFEVEVSCIFAIERRWSFWQSILPLFITSFEFIRWRHSNRRKLLQNIKIGSKRNRISISKTYQRLEISICPHLTSFREQFHRLGKFSFLYEVGQPNYRKLKITIIHTFILAN